MSIVGGNMQPMINVIYFDNTSNVILTINIMTTMHRNVYFIVYKRILFTITFWHYSLQNTQCSFSKLSMLLQIYTIMSKKKLIHAVIKERMRYTES